jgi:hypothetical protein
MPTTTSEITAIATIIHNRIATVMLFIVALRC